MNVSPTHSKLLYGTRPQAINNGIDEIVVKVRLRDAKDNPIPGRQVELMADRNDVDIEQPALTDINGLAFGTVKSTVAGSVNISARVFPPSNSSSSN